MASKIVQEAAQGEEGADLTLGAVVDEKMEGSLRVTVLATGFDRDVNARPRPAVATTTPPAATDPATGAAPSATTPAATESTQSAFDDDLPTYDEDDIDIPAFLRRR